MSKESLLKKEFKKSDVQRVRNLVNKDYTGKTSTKSGYSTGRTYHKEGEVWEEDGRTWTIKNGLKQNLTKTDSARDILKIPLRCPKCGGSMNHWLAKKMYRIHGFCFDPSTVEYETNLRKVGLYDQYEKRMIEGNMVAFAKDIEDWILNEIQQTDDFVTEDGVLEEWKGGKEANLKVLERLKEFSNAIKDRLGNL